MRIRFLAALGLSLVACGPHPELVKDSFTARGMVTMHREKHHESEPFVAYDAAPGFPLPERSEDDLSPAERASIPPPAPAREYGVAFDGPGARGALDAVDLGECRASGAPRGYGHAAVTYDEDGYAVVVLIDAPPGLSPEAVDCIGHALGRVTAPAYTGSRVTVATTWFVP